MAIPLKLGQLLLGSRHVSTAMKLRLRATTVILHALHDFKLADVKRRKMSHYTLFLPWR